MSRCPNAQKFRRPDVQMSRCLNFFPACPLLDRQPLLCVCVCRPKHWVPPTHTTLWPKPNTALSSWPAERAGWRTPTGLYGWHHLRGKNKALLLTSEIPVFRPPLPPKVPASAISAVGYISWEGDSWSFCRVDPFVVRPQSGVSVCVRTCRSCVHTCEWETYPANHAYFRARNILGTLCSPISRRPNWVCLCKGSFLSSRIEITKQTAGGDKKFCLPPAFVFSAWWQTPPLLTTLAWALHLGADKIARVHMLTLVWLIRSLSMSVVCLLFVVLCQIVCSECAFPVCGTNVTFVLVRVVDCFLFVRLI